MEFLNPGFLFAFSALVVPVLIHLFNLRRYRKEYFTNVKFLSQIQLETRKRSRLKQLLVLASRLLTVSALVMAFSQPFIPSPIQGGHKSGYKAVSIYVDNSYSMEAIGTQGQLLDIAKKRASEIVSAYKTSDIYQLITNDFEGKHSQFVSREEFLGMLRDVKISHSTVGLPQVLQHQSELFAGQKEAAHISFLVSDFQKTTTDFEGIKSDSTTHFLLVPVESVSQNNLYIDSIWFSSPVHRPGQSVKLLVRIRNIGNNNLEKIPLRLILNDIQKSVTSFNVEPYHSAEITLPYTEGKSGIQLGRLEVTDYPIIYDDKFWFTYSISPEISVLNIYGKSPNPYLKSLYTSDSVFLFRDSPSNQVDYGSFNKQNLILITGMDELSSGLASELKQFLERGGSVCIFPPGKLVSETYNAFFSSLGTSILGRSDTIKQRVASLDFENELFKDVFEKDASGKTVMPDNVDLPVVLKYYSLSTGTTNPASVLMRMQNGAPFLNSSGIGKGKLYLCASAMDPSCTNFQQHLLFVPVMFRMAFISENKSSLYNFIGRNEIVEIPSDSLSEKNILRIKKWDSPFEFIPELKTSGQTTQAYLHGQITDAGWYIVNRGNKQLKSLAFNYDRKESDIRCFSLDEIQTNIKKFRLRNFIVMKPSGIQFTKQVEQINMGFPLWKWFLVLALCFIAAEILIIRLSGS